MSLPDCVKAEN